VAAAAIFMGVPFAAAQQGGASGGADAGQAGSSAYPGGATPPEPPRSGAPDPYTPPRFLPGANLVQTPLTATDAYGNAQFDLPDRRELGIFQTAAEWEALGAYQMLNRIPDNRGGSSFFALPGDLLGLSTFGTLADAASPAVLADITPNQRLAFLQYGGFGHRIDVGQDDISAAFARRHRLITANMAYAPIYRSIMENSSLAGLRPLVSATPFMQNNAPARPDTAAPDQAPATDVPQGPSLYELLRTDSETAHRRTLREAWTLFEEGEYRHAAREFESVLTLDPRDPQARLGEIFCYVAVGAMRTAAVLVRKFAEIESDPFSHGMDVRTRLNKSLAQSLLSDSRLAVDPLTAASNANVTATYILLLWYLGEQDAALRGARTLARAPEGELYKDWPAKIEAARAVLPNPASR
jgi:hypothetical protein